MSGVHKVSVSTKASEPEITINLVLTLKLDGNGISVSAEPEKKTNFKPYDDDKVSLIVPDIEILSFDNETEDNETEDNEIEDNDQISEDHSEQKPMEVDSKWLQNGLLNIPIETTKDLTDVLNETGFRFSSG